MNVELVKKNSRVKTLLTVLALVSLCCAFVYGISQRGQRVLPTLEADFATGTVFSKVNTNPLVYEARGDEQGPLLNYIVVDEAQGYGGPLHIATVISPGGEIDRTIVIDNKETPSWFNKLEIMGFFEQFKGLHVAGVLEPGEDIDVITRATVSSNAFSRAIRNGSHMVGREYLGQTIVEKPVPWNFGVNEIALLGLYLLMLVGVFAKQKMLRYITLAGACLLIGFHLHNPIALSSLTSVALGFIQPLRENVFWWLLVFGTLGFTFLLGKNLYCSWLCPFGAIQEFAAKIGGINIGLNKKVFAVAKHLRYVLTWAALMVIFITSNGPYGSYEPFGTIFGLNGLPAQWYALPVIILGSFVLSRFWCRFFCPVGVVLDSVYKVRRKINKLFGRAPQTYPVINRMATVTPTVEGRTPCASACRGKKHCKEDAAAVNVEDTAGQPG